MPLTAEKRREWDRQKSKAVYEDLQDVGAPPDVVDPARRAACERDLDLFCTTYLSDVFYLAPAAFHLKAVEKMQTAVLGGGQFAWAQPRGSGKTSRAEACALWSILYGHRSYVLFVGASEDAALGRLQAIKVRLETSELLFEDFPEVCHPIRSLNRTARRAMTQKIDGEHTYIEWTSNKIVMPSVAGSNCSGSCLEVAGMTASIRGLNHPKPDGTVIRPDLAIVDDPQTRASAKSTTQTADRLAIISADIGYLPGPGIPIALLVPCTVIYQDDLADQLLNRNKYPEFKGERTKMVLSMPENMKIWEEYNDILRDSLQNDGDHTPANAFYESNRAAMDVGAEVSWPERKAPHQLSAVQHAMDLYFKDPSAFASEMQNEPIEANESGPDVCKPAEIAEKQSHLARYEVPRTTTSVVSFIDVQRDCLYHATMSFSEDYSGQVVDYGMWPDQKRRTYRLSELRRSLREHYETSSVEAAIFAGLDALVAHLGQLPLAMEGKGPFAKATHSCDLILIDAAYGDSTNVVKEVCRKVGNKVLPSFGRGIKATSNAMHLWAKQKGERIGPHWRRRRDKETSQPYVIYDSNWWKLFAHLRFKTGFGDRGCFSLFGKSHNRRPIDKNYHAHFGDQFCAEFPKRVESQGRVVHEWFLKREHLDNHFLDCVVGCAVAASMSGVQMAGAKRKAQKKAAETSMKDFFGR